MSSEFDDIAASDLSNFLVSFHKGGLIKKLIFMGLPTCVVSSKASLKHFVEILLQWAPVTVGHRGACSSTNFARTLFLSLLASGENVAKGAWDEAIDDLALIDAHSSSMTRSIHNDVSDLIDGSAINESSRVFLSVMNRLPVELPPGAIGQEEFDHFLAHVGMRSVKRPREEKNGDLAALGRRRMLRNRERSYRRLNGS